jgi:transcriptional regulator with XRE-family HTH domain
MNMIIATTGCCELGCGGTMEGRKGEYKYVESGLDTVVLKDILVFHCTTCNAIVPEIPAAGFLNRVIAQKLLLKGTLLTGDELRFLRKFCGYSVTEFAEIMGSSKSVICRWETKNHGASTDRTIRLLVLFKLMREMVGQPEPTLKNVTFEELNSKVEAAFKSIEDRDVDEHYEISPEDIAQFGGGQSIIEQEVSPVN